MKSYTTWILCFSVSIWSAFAAYGAILWWMMIVSAVFWIIGLWGFYFTERSNKRNYSLLDKALRREKKCAAEELLEALYEINGLQDDLEKEKLRKNIVAGSHMNMDELKKHLKKGETA